MTRKLHWFLGGSVLLLAFGCVAALSDSSGDVFPVVFQERSNDCGLAALATLAQTLGRPVELQTLAQEVDVPEEGLSMLALQELAALHAIELHGFRVPRQEALRLATPWIAHLQDRRDGHFVVVQKVSAAGMTISDPAAGVRRVPVRQFMSLWSGRALVILR